MLPCLIFNIHPIVPAAVFALVMDIIAVDRPVPSLQIAAAQAAKIGIVIIRCHHARTMALGAFHLDASGEGVVGTVCKVGFINNSVHTPTHSSYYKVVVFIDPLQGLYAILLEILWIVFTLLPPDGLRKATTTVSLYIC